MQRFTIGLLTLGLLLTGSVDQVSAQDVSDDNPFDPRPVTPVAPVETSTLGVEAPDQVTDTATESDSILSREEIRERLARPTSAEFIEVPLRDVIHYHSDYMEVPFVIDQVALDDEGLTGDEPVSLDLKLAMSEAALNESLRGLDLDFVVMDGYVLVSTRTQLEEMDSVRVYNCSKLLSRLPGESFGSAPPRDGDSQFVRMIKHAAAPGTWYTPTTSGEANQGPGEFDGTITQLGGVLIIRHNLLVHRQIEQLLADLDDQLPATPSTEAKPDERLRTESDNAPLPEPPPAFRRE